MSRKAYLWQEQPEVLALIDRVRSWGAWAVVMHARMIIADDGCDEQTFDHVNDVHIQPRLEKHGEPPPAFVKCWLLDLSDTYGWLSDKGDITNRERYRKKLASARNLWRRFVTEEKAA